MNTVDRALEKQRLQFQIAQQRESIAGYGAGLTPLFAAADHMVAATHWIKRHPQAMVGAVAVLVAARPRRWRFFWRLARRSFFAWRLWHDSERWLGPLVKPR